MRFWGHAADFAADDAAADAVPPEEPVFSADAVPQAASAPARISATNKDVNFLCISMSSLPRIFPFFAAGFRLLFSLYGCTIHSQP